MVTPVQMYKRTECFIKRNFLLLIVNYNLILYNKNRRINKNININLFDTNGQNHGYEIRNPSALRSEKHNCYITRVAFTVNNIRKYHKFKKSFSGL